MKEWQEKKLKRKPFNFKKSVSHLGNLERFLNMYAVKASTELEKTDSTLEDIMLTFSGRDRAGRPRDFLMKEKFMDLSDFLLRFKLDAEDE